MPDSVVIVETTYSPQIVEISSVPTSVEVTIPISTNLVELTSVGPQGPQGIQGVAGPTGPQGASGGTPQKFDITVSSGTWIVYHGLSRLPSAIQAFLTSGELIQPDIFIDTQKITVVLASPNTGFIVAI